MTNRFGWMRGVAAGMALIAAVACGGKTAEQPQALNSDLQRDLDLAGAAGVTTTASAGVVSAEEQAPHGRRPASRPRQAASTPEVHQAAPVETRAEETVAQAPVDTGTITVAPSPRPVVPAPAPQRGGTKTVGQVIRDAPFPIFP